KHKCSCNIFGNKSPGLFWGNLKRNWGKITFKTLQFEEEISS
ncbi:unnamed protein product, partial [Allacma fusca]